MADLDEMIRDRQKLMARDPQWRDQGPLTRVARYVLTAILFVVAILVLPLLLVCALLDLLTGGFVRRRITSK